MRGGRRIGCITPAFNEAEAIARVVAHIPRWVDRIVVADNGSSDATAALARAAGAEVVSVTERGYGAACLGGMAVLGDVDIVVFLDGDFSDVAEEMHRLVDPIVAGRAHLVIGSRTLGGAEPGALTPQQIFGNWLATRLVRLVWGVDYTDLGPFRAIAETSLRSLGMEDRTYGWTVEMQIKAARHGLVAIERPVSYRRRIGVSKISGTVRGTIRAGTRILWLIGREALRGHRRS